MVRFRTYLLTYDSDKDYIYDSEKYCNIFIYHGIINNIYVDFDTYIIKEGWVYYTEKDTFWICKKPIRYISIRPVFYWWNHIIRKLEVIRDIRKSIELLKLISVKINKYNIGFNLLNIIGQFTNDNIKINSTKVAMMDKILIVPNDEPEYEKEEEYYIDYIKYNIEVITYTKLSNHTKSALRALKIRY